MCEHSTRAFNELGEVIALACDRWDCGDCRKILSWRWAQTVRYGIALWPTHKAYFWTLTLPPWVLSADTGYRVLPERWDNLRKTVQRAQGQFHYCAFVEAHPHRQLIPHFHIITLNKAPTRLKDMAVHCGFGYQAQEVEINAGMAVSYVAKYASKADMAIPKHFRRVRVSRSWPRLPEPEYPLKVYPLEKREALTAYLRRMSVTLGRPLDVLRSAWLDKSGDIA